MQAKYDLLVIGGGAAGFFGAVNAAQMQPGLKVAIVEKTSKWLMKVKVSGGGRCNVTHHCDYPSQLVKNYPRGGKFLKKVFDQFDAKATVNWFEEQGIALKTEADGRIFPVTDSSQTIIDCFMQLAGRLRIDLIPNFTVTGIEKKEDLFTVKGGEVEMRSSNILVTIGGQPKDEGFLFINALNHSIISPVPSLFTFNVPENGFQHLAGVSVPQAGVKIIGRNLSALGPLLATHWGFSGPAVLRLSAWGARDLAESKYKAGFLVNWLGEEAEEPIRKMLESQTTTHPKKVVAGDSLFGLPARLWATQVERAGIAAGQRWLDLSKKDKNRLLEMVVRCPFEMNGKTTFKDEFVTCGGVNLDEVNPQTMESKLVPGLFFAGEVLDIDGITGGFNFQNAWSGAWVAAKAITGSLV